MLEPFAGIESGGAVHETWVPPIGAFAEPINALRALKTEASALLSNPNAPPFRINDWCERAHDRLAWLAVHNPAGIELWREILLPFFLRSPFLRRCCEKPRGYAGDYLTIQMMYDHSPRQIESFAMAVEAWAMAQPCPKAVRNRRNLVRAFVDRACAGGGYGRPSIVSLGCGPATEVFETLRDCAANFTLIDIDEDAIGFVQAKARNAGMSDRIAVRRANIIKMALGAGCDMAEGQRAFYSLGLVDYLTDAVFIRLLDYIHDKLTQGGRVLLGNFRPAHRNVAFFEHALDWPLTLRSERDLLRLVKQSRFAGCPTTIGTEPERVQLFVECVKG